MELTSSHGRKRFLSATMLLVLVVAGTFMQTDRSLADSSTPRLSLKILVVFGKETDKMTPLLMLLSSLGQGYNVWNNTLGKIPLQVMKTYALVIDADRVSDASDDWQAVNTFVSSGGWFVKESLCAIPGDQIRVFGLAYSGRCYSKSPGPFEFVLSTSLYPYPFAWNATSISTAVAVSANTIGAQVLAYSNERNGTQNIVAFASFSPNQTSGRLFYIGTNVLVSTGVEIGAYTFFPPRGFIGLGGYFHSYILDEVYKSKTHKPLRENWVGVDTPLPVGIIIDDFTGHSEYLNYASIVAKQNGLKLSLATEVHEWTEHYLTSQLTRTVLSDSETFELINHLWDHNSTYHSLEAIDANFRKSQEAFIQNAKALGPNADGWKYVVHPGQADNETIARVAQRYGIAAIITYRNESYPFHSLCDKTLKWCQIPYNMTGWIPYHSLPSMGVLQVPRYSYPLDTNSSVFVPIVMLYIREAIAYNMPLILGTHPKDWSKGSSVLSSLLGVVQTVNRSPMGADFEFVSRIIEPHVVTCKSDGAWIYVQSLSRASRIISSEFLAGRLNVTIISSPGVSTTLRVISAKPEQVVGAASWEYDSQNMVATLTLGQSVSNIVIYFAHTSASTQTSAFTQTEAYGIVGLPLAIAAIAVAVAALALGMLRRRAKRELNTHHMRG